MQEIASSGTGFVPADLGGCLLDNSRLELRERCGSSFRSWAVCCVVSGDGSGITWISGLFLSACFTSFVSLRERSLSSHFSVIFSSFTEVTALTFSSLRESANDTPEFRRVTDTEVETTELRLPNEVNCWPLALGFRSFAWSLLEEPKKIQDVGSDVKTLVRT